TSNMPSHHSGQQEVAIRDFQKDILLTHRFQKSNEPLEVIKEVLTYIDTDQGSWIGRPVIVINVVLDKTKVAISLFIVILVFSMLLGVGTGLTSHSAEAGVNASAGMFTLGTFVLALIAFVYH
ncbi:MAG: hypothetical protein Q9174_005580, partial [Haloplaca sp. 1 TL-2023]